MEFELDLTAVLSAIASTAADIGVVGTGIIGLAALAMSIRWVKATFF